MRGFARSVGAAGDSGDGGEERKGGDDMKLQSSQKQRLHRFYSPILTEHQTYCSINIC